MSIDIFFPKHEIHNCPHHTLTMEAPGLVFLWSNINVLLIPPAIGHMFVVIFRRGFHYTIPTWLALVIYVAAYPVIAACMIFVQDSNKIQNAKLLGAVVPPRVRDGTVGNTKTLGAMLRMMKDGYVGMCYSILAADNELTHLALADAVEEICKELGHTLTIRMLFQDRVRRATFAIPTRRSIV